MSEKFKVGDRVRITRDCRCEPNETLVKEGSVGEVCDTDKGYREVVIGNLDDAVWVHVCNLEPAPPADPKSAFLKDLAECLRRHNAKIIGQRMSAIIDGEDGAILFCDSHFNDFTELTADNVMPTY